MFAANLAAAVLVHVPRAAAWIVQEGGAVGWDPISLWKQMGIIAKIVVIILFIMSGWSIGVMIDRAMAYNAARKQSRAFAPAVAGALRDGRIDEAIKVAERNKKSHLATIGSTAPFVGLFGTVMGILNAFKGISEQKATGLGAVAGGISEALVTTAFGLLVAIPAVMMFNYLTGRVEAFDVEMDNSSSELIDYFLKRRDVRRS